MVDRSNSRGSLQHCGCFLFCGILEGLESSFKPSCPTIHCAFISDLSAQLCEKRLHFPATISNATEARAPHDRQKVDVAKSTQGRILLPIYNPCFLRSSGGYGSSEQFLLCQETRPNTFHLPDSLELRIPSAFNPDRTPKALYAWHCANLSP